VRHVIAAPAFVRRRTLAAAGASPPRRPRAARPAVAVLAAVLLAAAMSACSAGQSPSASGNVFTTRQQVTRQDVQRAIGAVYRSHPGIGSFTAQDVEYTAQSRSSVLAACISANAGTSAQAAESGQVIACAPLIFFLYSYGKQASVPGATAAAGKLYWYAITHIAGPIDARSSLDELMHSWKLPVPGPSAAASQNAVIPALITAAQQAILGRKSVHLVITSHPAGDTVSARRIVADIGTVTGTESIASARATAAIRVTRRDAYFSGSPTGLTAFIGLRSRQ
jgi:hypothetical protein